MRRPLASLLLVASTVAAPVRAQQPGVDIVSYKYRVILPDTGSEVEVSSEIAFRRGDQAGDTLALDLVGMDGRHGDKVMPPRPVANRG